MDTTYLLGHGELVLGIRGGEDADVREKLVNTEEGRLIRELLKALVALGSRRLLLYRLVSINSSKEG